MRRPLPRILVPLALAAALVVPATASAHTGDAVTLEGTLEFTHSDNFRTKQAQYYYSLRQGRVSRPLQDPEMISLDPAVRRRVPERNVAEVAYRLWRKLRAGDFRIAPRTCEGCGLQASCRIPAAPSALAEPTDPTGEGSTESSTRRTPLPSTVSPTADWPTEPARTPGRR